VFEQSAIVQILYKHALIVPKDRGQLTPESLEAALRRIPAARQMVSTALISISPSIRNGGVSL